MTRLCLEDDSAAVREKHSLLDGEWQLFLEGNGEFYPDDQGHHLELRNGVTSGATYFPGAFDWGLLWTWSGPSPVSL